MLIEHQWHAYNTRRYGSPWAAQITFNGVKPVYMFIGRYASGRLAFEATLGDIIAMGQKDRRGNRTQKDFYVVGENGLEPLTGEDEAFTLWREGQAETVNTPDEMCVTIDDAIAELVRLREINATLVMALEMAHDEIHHPGAARHCGVDIDAIIRIAKADQT